MQAIKKNLNNIKMRASNYALVINAIRQKERISRTDLVPLVGLTSATITNLVNCGIQDGYIIEVGSGSSQGGRRPKLLELNKDVGYIVGIEINAEEAICLLTDFKQNIIAKEYLAIDSSLEAETLLDDIAEVVNGFLADHNLTHEDIFGAGFATVGPVDHIKGIIVNTPNFPKWHNVKVLEMFEKKTGIKGYMEKDVAAFALNESWCDKNNLYKRILCVNVCSVGIGGGLALDKEIFHGHKSAGLEIGHMTVQHDGPVCVCGKKGCLEIMADGKAAKRYVKEYIEQGTPTKIKDLNNIKLKEIIENVGLGDEACILAIKKCANYLGEAISSLISILAPDVIFIGGEFIVKSGLFFDETVNKAKERTYPFIDSDIQILKATSGKDSSALGAVALVIKSIFAAS